MLVNAPLMAFAKIRYQSVSHTFSKAVIAAYNNVTRYGYEFDGNTLRVKQARRELVFCFGDAEHIRAGKDVIFLSEHPLIGATKTKEVCYDLEQLFAHPSSELSRGIKFTQRPQVVIEDYKQDSKLDAIYARWVESKLSNPKLYRMTFNPKRYYRSYELKNFGFNIYQKMIWIRDIPYAVINFALEDERAFELSFLSRFQDRDLRLINDQNECIMAHCLHDLYVNHGIKMVNLGTAAGIKGLALFKHKFPYTEQIVYVSHNTDV